MVIYAGRHTKIMMNQGKTPFKQSKFERVINKIVVIELVVQTILCVVLALRAAMFATDNSNNSYIFDSMPYSAVLQGFMAWATFFLLLNSLIPISMIISLEVVKFLQSLLIEADIRLYGEEVDKPAKVQTLNIQEELGLVDYIFSDKTGTLTSNVMEFKCCTVTGVVYAPEGYFVKGKKTPETPRNSQDPFNLVTIQEDGAERSLSYHMTPVGAYSTSIKSPVGARPDVLWTFDTNLLMSEIALGVHSRPCSEYNQCEVALRNQADYLSEFWTAVLLCNEVVADTEAQRIVYMGASPDEVTLVDAAKQIGFVFLHRCPESIQTSINSQLMEFPILTTLEFTSVRRRMSVIVRNPVDQSIRLYMKGADISVLQKMDMRGIQPFQKQTFKAVQEFAVKGLRTLCVAMKVIPVDVYERWREEYERVKCSVAEGKDRRLQELGEEIEEGVFLIGATGLEDQLQKGVPKCIRQFMEAEIKVWMITGDKLETAQNVGLSCSILDEKTTIFKIPHEAGNMEQLLESLTQDVEQQKMVFGFKYALLVEGDALPKALVLPSLFFPLCKSSQSVICCRTNPKQKADIVRFIRHQHPQATTLAIGDGGNDVNMIQTAHVGVGLYGKEGYQAAGAADFSLSEFRQLRRLLFVHGRWNSKRIAFFILFYFFKNILFTLPQFHYAFVSGFSGQTIWEDWYLLLYNSAITALGVGLYSVFEQDHNPVTNPDVKPLLARLYHWNRRRELVNLRVFLLWFLYGVFGSLMVSVFPSYIYWGCLLNSSGQVDGLWAMSVCMYTSVIVSVNVILVINIQYWTWFANLVIWLFSWALYCPVFVFIYDNVPTSQLYANTRDFMSTFDFWWAVVLSSAVTALPFYFVVTWKRLFGDRANPPLREAETLVPLTESGNKGEEGEFKHLTGSTMHSSNKGSGPVPA